MALFDTLKRAAMNALKKEITETAQEKTRDVGKGTNREEKFTFGELPVSVAQLQAMPEAKLDTPFKTAALTMAVLCHYGKDPEATFEMLNVLKGPAPITNPEKQFIRERLTGKVYKPLSFFEGATPDNGYVPKQPYTISIMENPYSFDNAGWAVLWVKSSGGDHPRQLKLRHKPSTNQWFLNEIQCLSDIRIPVAEDPWA